MRFSIRNFGKVNVADIELKGITVIAGPNGSGKSTISRALFTWQTYLRQLDREMIDELADSVIDDVNTVLMENDLPRVSSSFGERRRSSEKVIDRAFWQNRDNAVKWIVENLARRVVERYSEVDAIVPRIFDLYPKLQEKAYARLDKKDERMDKFLLERHFNRAFDRQVGTLFAPTACSSIEIENDAGLKRHCVFLDGRVVELENAHGGHVAHMYYLEPRHLIDEVGRTMFLARGVRFGVDRYSVDSANRWERILNTNPDVSDQLFARAERQEAINRELDKIVSMLHGEIVKDEQALVFRDSDIAGDNSVSLKNIASGVKTMAAIIRGMRNSTISPGDYIIIDEPETNLHPEWQVAFARFLVLINAKFDIRVLLNTHSPYFLKSIVVNADLLERGECCAYYNMIPAKDGLRYDTDHVNGRIESVFKAMSEPFARLSYGEHYGHGIPR